MPWPDTPPVPLVADAALDVSVSDASLLAVPPVEKSDALGSAVGTSSPSVGRFGTSSEEESGGSTVGRASREVDVWFLSMTGEDDSRGSKLAA